ncbi:hypothetical protein DE146DRAFT_790413 [Phaeosphaeria sp. MPI-PUGE-AT-0046c]|nr:hypothetical protein DE146DRAFT_790413 [Phaeosphaeria sp. MPI-PUGE-AT-0046c]
MAAAVSSYSTSLKPFKAHCDKIAKHYTRLLTLWPKDAFRPNLPFTRAIEQRGQPYGLKPLEPTQDVPKAQPHAATPAPASPPNPQAEQAQVNALYSLLESRYTKKFPLSDGLLRPTAAPEHYDLLMAEIARAPQRTWWQATLESWKTKIRWS